VTKRSLRLLVIRRQPVPHRDVPFHPIDENRHRHQTRVFKGPNQLGNVGLLSDDVLAVEEESDGGGV